ncbi:hypothetical protein KY330_05575 [Candidatus Woesearchaeota archaeon]|nr:hypothetical protein [Candidatus Woesearchaeota archaeon]
MKLTRRQALQQIGAVLGFCAAPALAKPLVKPLVKPKNPTQTSNAPEKPYIKDDVLYFTYKDLSKYSTERGSRESAEMRAREHLMRLLNMKEGMLFNFRVYEYRTESAWDGKRTFYRTQVKCSIPTKGIWFSNYIAPRPMYKTPDKQ